MSKMISILKQNDAQKPIDSAKQTERLLALRRDQLVDIRQELVNGANPVETLNKLIRTLDEHDDATGSKHVVGSARETRKRSLIKVAAYRTCMFFVTTGASFAAMKTSKGDPQLQTALMTGFYDLLSKFGVQFIFERASSHVQFGYKNNGKETVIRLE